MNYTDEIVQDAKQYTGQQEIQPNLGFKDPAFAKKMVAAGFYRTASWCGFFVMMVLFEIYAGSRKWLSPLKKYCSASTHEMWLNFRASPDFMTGQIPKLGAIVIWVEGSGTNGHTGLVTAISADGKHFTSVEGNSNSDGSRNGYEVAQNTHTLGLPHSVNGLNLLGFVYMPDSD